MVTNDKLKFNIIEKIKNTICSLKSSPFSFFWSTLFIPIYTPIYEPGVSALLAFLSSKL